MDFLARFKQSPIYSVMLGLILLLALGVEWRGGLLYYKGAHTTGNWDFYFLLILEGTCGSFLTVSGIWGLLRPPLDRDN